MLIFVRPSVRPVQVCLELSIFISGQSQVSLRSVSGQSQVSHLSSLLGQS